MNIYPNTAGSPLHKFAPPKLRQSDEQSWIKPQIWHYTPLQSTIAALNSPNPSAFNHWLVVTVLRTGASILTTRPADPRQCLLNGGAAC